MPIEPHCVRRRVGASFQTIPGGFVPRCDVCLNVLGPAATADDAVANARGASWTVEPGDGAPRLTCPDADRHAALAAERDARALAALTANTAPPASEDRAAPASAAQDAGDAPGDEAPLPTDPPADE